MFEIQAAQLEKLNALVKERAGLHIDDHRLPGVLTALRQAYMTDFDEMMEALSLASADSLLWQSLLNAVTIGETYFFRNKSHIDALQNHILPALIQQRRKFGQKFLRIWSTGCATGEEPFSIAMLLHEMIPDLENWLITIMATDINAASLERARRGLYSTNSFRNETRSTIKDKWFTPHGTSFELSSTIKRMVNFKFLNLISDDYPAYTTNTMNMDVILCRNVTIYFDKQETTQVVKRLHQALNHGGWLIVGHSEPQPAVYDAFQMVPLENAIFYRKPETSLMGLQPVPTVPVQPMKTIKPLPEVPTPAPIVCLKADEVLLRIKAAADTERWDDALALLTKYEVDYRLNPYAHYLRAVIYLHSGYTDAAFAALRQSLYCDPNFILAQALMGDCYAQRKKIVEAQRHWHLALKAVSSLEPSTVIPFTDDLTVAMMREILNYHLKETANALS